MTVLTPEDRAAIGDLNARFAWALDLKEYDSLRDLFTPDCHYASTGGEFFGVDQLIEAFRARTGTRTTRHGQGNLLLDGVTASTVNGRGSWHTFASNAEPPQGVDVYMVADFRDRYVLAKGT
ncbi:nuclear transport factor 2 family protein, partial [Arthrobacter sp. 2YAF22_2]|uniref:nuclear transport factor 2 family protein n=1 Tax=Arthrobacter sp. 2YAF22_2 TaxID=3233029 RepID=UPI003F904944